MTDRDPLADLLTRVPEPGPGAAVVAVAGPVAVGKSTFAATVAEHLLATGRSVEIVATDGFLLSNADLEARGLLARKGFPETYDLDRLTRVVDAAHNGHDTLEVPVYSHESYDVDPEPRRMATPDVLVVEGIIALHRPSPGLGIYLDADEEDVIAWYVERFHDLVEAARRAPASFYRQWIDLDRASVTELARAVWDAVNHPNLVDHIAPSRVHADLVVRKGPDHRILSVGSAP